MDMKNILKNKKKNGIKNMENNNIEKELNNLKIKRKETTYEKWKRLISFKRLSISSIIFTVIAFGVFFEIEVHLKVFLGFTIMDWDNPLIILTYLSFLYLSCFAILTIMSIFTAKNIVGNWVNDNKNKKDNNVI